MEYLHTDEEQKKEKKILVLAVGGGGGRVAADLLAGSRHFRKLVSSVYFLNTNKKDLDEIFNKDMKKLDGTCVEILPSDEEPCTTFIPVRYWWYGYTGAGGDFVRSRRMMRYWLFHDEYQDEMIEQELSADDVEKDSFEVEEPFEDAEEFKNEAEGVMETMKREIVESDMILLIHSLGGGTGGGGTPVLARYLQKGVKAEYQKDRIVISLCFLADFHEEILTRANSARNLMEISKNVNIVLLFSNENLITQIRKELPSLNSTKQPIFRKLNSRIVSAVEILTTAMCEEKITKPLDFHDLYTFSLGLPTNIIIPFLAPESESINLKVPCLDCSLKYGLVPFHPGGVVKALPIIVSNKKGIEEIDNHPKEMYEEIFSKKLKLDMTGYVGDIRGVLDDNGGNPMKALALGFGLVDLSPYIGVLDDIVYQWEAFHEQAHIENPNNQTHKVIEAVREWYNKYMNDVKTFVSKRKGGIE
jgi:hypothetical protein